MTHAMCPSCSAALSEFIRNGTTLAGSQKINAPSLGSAITQVITAKKQAGRRARTIQALRIYLNQFARGRETIPIDSVDIDTLEAWFLVRNEKPISKLSNIGRLSSLFSFAVRRGWMQSNPCQRLEKPFIDQSVPRIMTIPQIESALTFARDIKPKFLAWLTLALLVGLRPESEADKVRWENIDLNNARLTLCGSATKVRQHRIIDLSLTPALPWLRLAKQMESPLDLCSKARRRYTRMLRDHLGEWPQDWCRHTAASYLLQHHQDAGKVAMLLGNSQSILHRHYKSLVAPEDAKRFMELHPAT